MGVDFGINTYDEDFVVMVLQKHLTSQIDEIVKDAETFDIDALKRMYPNRLDRSYNVCLIADNDFRQLLGGVVNGNVFLKRE